MKTINKIKAILIIAILVAVCHMYYDEITEFVKQLPFFPNSCEYEPETDRGSFEYYFTSYSNN